MEKQIEEMAKEQIIKALECCTSGHCYLGAGCPLAEDDNYDDDIAKCTSELAQNALALIKELTEKVEAYRQELGKVRVALNDANADNKRFTEENERLSTALANYDRQTEVRIAEDYYTAEAYDELREENERLKQLNESYSEIEQGYIVTGVQKVKSDTVREFAERLKYTLCINNEENTEFFDYSYTLETIDEVANKILNNTEEEKK